MDRAEFHKTKPSETGAVLLTTLLVMTLMAALSVALIEDIRFAIKRAASTQAYAQADWYAASADAFALSYLAAEFASSEPAQINRKLRENTPFVLPIDSGSITLEVRDGTQCFALPRLVNAPARQELETLLDGIGVNAFDARRISFAAADWIDEDSALNNNGAEDFTYLVKQPAYRAANAHFMSLMEMRAVHGMSEDIYQSLRPFVCARAPGQSAKINLNTLSLGHKALLAAALGGGRANEDLAEALITERPNNGYEDVAEMLEQFGFEEGLPEGTLTDNITLVPEFIWVEADIRYRNARRVVSMEFSVEVDNIIQISRYVGDEARRPLPELDAATGRLRNRLNRLSE